MKFLTKYGGSAAWDFRIYRVHSTIEKATGVFAVVYYVESYGVIETRSITSSKECLSETWEEAVEIALEMYRHTVRKQTSKLMDILGSSKIVCEKAERKITKSPQKDDPKRSFQKILLEDAV